MGVSLQQWRSSIGSFSSILINRLPKIKPSNNKCNGKTESSGPGGITIIFLVLAALLLIGGVEQNPGPGDEVLPQSVPELYNMLKGLINTRTDETLSAVNEVKQEIGSTNNKIDNLTSDLQGAQDQISTLKSDNKELLARVDRLENETRKNNAVFFGLPEESEGENIIDTVKSFANKMLSIVLHDNDVATSYRLGKNKGKRPILVSFNTQKIKLDIMKAAPKLKGSKMSISDDLTPKARAAKKLLLKCAHEARSMNLATKIKGRTLEVNGQIFTHDMLQNPSWLRDANVSRHTGGKKRHLSNDSSLEEDSGNSTAKMPLSQETLHEVEVPASQLAGPTSATASSSVDPAPGNMNAPSLPHSQHQSLIDMGVEGQNRERSSSRGKGKKKAK